MPFWLRSIHAYGLNAYFLDEHSTPTELKSCLGNLFITPSLVLAHQMAITHPESTHR